ncbi:MAG: hypothetical protein ACOYMG_04120 [Candidatus Methylumidiphilus sp.]
MRYYHQMRIQDANTVIVRLKSLLKAESIVFLLMCIVYPSMALAYDFTLSAYGSNRVVVGHDLYISEISALTEGTRDYALHYVDGLPTGATASWPKIQETCCGGNRGWEPHNTLLKINVLSTVPTGTYNLTLRVESGGVTHKIPYNMVVDAVPSPLPKQVISTIPPIPSLSTWESNMKTYGESLCKENNIKSQGTWEGNLWYYDGIRVYYQIADYTGSPSWNVCAGYVENVFKPYVLASSVPGWRVFPHGLYQDYLRNNDATSKAAAIRLSTVSSYAGSGGDVSFGVNGLQRETAYLIHAYRIAGLLGSPNPKLYARSVDFVLGMIDQMFVSKTDPYLKPFMTGLMAEALIQYYEETKDPRVPPAIKALADGLWERAWMPDKKAFYYQNTDSPLTASPDLNLLIAPAYAWLYKITGNPVYQQEGDLIFQGGVTGAWLAQGKQFSQNYRWSFDYVNWRLHPDITPPPVPALLKVIK